MTSPECVIPWEKIASPYNIHVLDFDGNIITTTVVSPLDGSAGLRGRNINEFIRPSDCARYRSVIEDAVKDQIHMFVTYRLLKVDARFIALILPDGLNRLVVRELVNHSPQAVSAQKKILLQSAGLLPEKTG